MRDILRQPLLFRNGPSVPRNWCLSAKHLEPIIYRWVKPWTAEIPWTKTKGPVYEWARHEGDTMISTILRGARVAEAAAAQKKLNETESALTWLETFAVRRVKTRPSVTSSRTIESRPFKSSTSRLARNGGRSRPAADYGYANSRNPPLSPACAGVFKPLQHSGKLLAHVQQSLDPIGLRRCRTRPRGGGVGKGVLAVRRRTRDSTHRCVELHQQGLPPSVLQGLPRYGEPDAGGDGLALRSPGQTLEKRTAPSRLRQVEHAAARELVKGIRTGHCNLHTLPAVGDPFVA